MKMLIVMMIGILGTIFLLAVLFGLILLGIAYNERSKK